MLDVDVFETVRLGKAALGIFPLENSSNGAVLKSLELLADRQNRYQNLKICQEVYLDISHFLLGRYRSENLDHSPTLLETRTPDLFSLSSPTLRSGPLSRLKHITRIYSHPQVWGQCENFLSAYLNNIECIDVDSTSKAAQLAAEDVTGTSAAIASRLASKVYGLRILAEEIEDDTSNMTRFLVLHKEYVVKAGLSERTKTMITFHINQETPGALTLAMKCFAIYSLNLTSISSRPSNILPFRYIFFVEFQGSTYNDPQYKVKNALNELRSHVQNLKCLGSWDDELQR